MQIRRTASLLSLVAVALILGLSPLGPAEARGMAAHGGVGVSPSQFTLGIARQATALSRLRAQQAVADRTTAMMTGIGTAGLGAGGFLAGGAGGFIGASSVTAPGTTTHMSRAANSVFVPVVETPAFVPGQIQIIRGQNVEIVSVEQQR